MVQGPWQFGNSKGWACHYGRFSLLQPQGLRRNTVVSCPATAAAAAACACARTQYSQLLEPLRPSSKPAARRLQELLACHKRFCEQQLANKKTSRVLEAAFDAEFTQQYMEQVRLSCLALSCLSSAINVVRCLSARLIIICNSPSLWAFLYLFALWVSCAGSENTPTFGLAPINNRCCPPF